MDNRADSSQPDPATSEHAAAGSRFNTTLWSVVLAAGHEDSPGSAKALEKLCGTYWYPLYAYARRQGHRPEDAQDLTQQFFAGFIERKKSFGLADPKRGRFRCFLLASFKHFLTNDFRRARATKRGGQYTFVSWDQTQAEAQYQNEPACEASPDKLFERAWALTLLDKVMKGLQSEYSEAGKQQVFEALQIFLSGEKAETTYADVGAGLQMTESAVKMAVLRLRRAYGERLRGELAQTLTSPDGVEDELRHLMRTLA